MPIADSALRAWDGESPATARSASRVSRGCPYAASARPPYAAWRIPARPSASAAARRTAIGSLRFTRARPVCEDLLTELLQLNCRLAQGLALLVGASQPAVELLARKRHTPS